MIIGYHRWVRRRGGACSDDGRTPAVGADDKREEVTAGGLKELLYKSDIQFQDNQKISDFTALRGIASAQHYLTELFNVSRIVHLLQESKNNTVPLTPREQRQHFDHIKTLCFAKIITALYIVLVRLWAHRIQVNLLARQHLHKLVTEIRSRRAEENIVAVQTLVDVAWRSGALPFTVSSSDTETRVHPETIAFTRKRLSSYHPRQNPTLIIEPAHSTSSIAVQYRAHYIFLSITCSLETSAYYNDMGNCVLEAVTACMRNTSPQDKTTFYGVKQLLHQIMEQVDTVLFATPNETFLYDSSLIPRKTITWLGMFQGTAFAGDTECDGGQPVLTNAERSASATKVEKRVAVPSIPCCDDVGPEVSEGRLDASPSAAKEPDEQQWVKGWSAEAQDIVESPCFRSVFHASRAELVDVMLKGVAEQLPEGSRGAASFPLCRLFGSLSSVADHVLREQASESTLETGVNVYMNRFAELQRVNELCRAIYFPLPVAL